MVNCWCLASIYEASKKLHTSQPIWPLYGTITQCRIHQIDNFRMEHVICNSLPGLLLFSGPIPIHPGVASAFTFSTLTPASTCSMKNEISEARQIRAKGKAKRSSSYDKFSIFFEFNRILMVTCCRDRCQAPKFFSQFHPVNAWINNQKCYIGSSETLTFFFFRTSTHTQASHEWKMDNN